MKRLRACLTAIVVIILGESFFLSATSPLTGVPVLEPRADDAMLMVKRNLLLESNIASDWLFLGDSSCGTGIIPKVIESQTGVPCLNGGTLSSFTMMGYVDLAKQFLESGHRPRRIVFVVLPRAFTLSTEDIESFGLYPRYAIAFGRPSYGLSLGLEKRWSLFLRRHEVNRFPPEFGGSYKVFRSELYKSRGWWAERNHLIEATRTELDFHLADWSINILDEVAKEASKYNCTVHVCLSPRPEGMVTEDYWRRAVSELRGASRKKSWSVLDWGSGIWEIKWFGTESHLTPQGAERYSSQIGSALELIDGQEVPVISRGQNAKLYKIELP